SVLSIPLSLVIATVIGLAHYLLQLYLTMTIPCRLTTLKLVRIPPLSPKEATYNEQTGSQLHRRPKGDTTPATAKPPAYRRAAGSDGPKGLLKDGTSNVIDICGGLIPVVIAIGTIALILAEYTPVFTFLSYPVQMFLDFIQVPEAAAAAPAFIIG